MNPDAIKTGGHAYPLAFPDDVNTKDYAVQYGMTLRDKFADSAMQGRLAGNATWRDLDFKPVDGLSVIENECLLAYRIADAMLAARSTA